MTLTPEQKQAVASWVAAGDNLSVVQKKLGEQFKLTMTYRDVRFLVDDLDLALKDPAPKIDVSDLSKASAARPASAEKKAASTASLGRAAPADAVEEAAPGDEIADELGDDDDLEDLTPAGGAVTVDVDKVTLLPGALASGSVKFSDGVTGKWVVDQYGRPGFTEISKPGYRPSQADSQAFIQELSAQLQKRGF